MNRSMRLLSVLSTGALLGCSQFAQAPAQREAVATAGNRASVPQRAARASMAGTEVEHLWLQGRAAQSRGQLELARAHYARVLREQPAHVGALNAMAVIDAQTDRLEQAIGLLRQALVLQPRASHLFNNLGYALLLAGRLDEAQAALDEAQALNPSSALTQQNRELLAQARTRGATVAALPADSGESSSAAASPSLVAVAPNIYQLRDPVSASAPAPVRTQADGAPTLLTRQSPSQRLPATGNALGGVRIEVSNGVGVRHMARRTAERLATLGLVAVRLTNQPGFRQAKTELQFRGGQQEAAQSLAGHLPRMPQVLPGRQLAGNVQLRLVLGHDQVGQAVMAWLDEAANREAAASAPQPVALNPQQGWRWS